MIEKIVSLPLIKSIYKPRGKATNKGDFGHALIVAGNSGKMGAAIISCRACVRSGAGLTSVACPLPFFPIIHISCPEAMCVERKNILKTGMYSAVLVGPGLGLNTGEASLLCSLLNNIDIPLVLDADAITIMAANPDLFVQLPFGSVLTPHPKEFDRLFGSHNSNEERIATAISFTVEKKCVVILKDYETVIIDGSDVYRNNQTGHQGLAKGGSGDALAGMVASFLAQGYSSLHASILGVFLHGLAADLTVKNQSFESMVITDVIENMGAAFKRIAE